MKTNFFFNIHTISEVLGFIILILMLIFIPPLLGKYFEKFNEQSTTLPCDKFIYKPNGECDGFIPVKSINSLCYGCDGQKLKDL
tara:strand:+ start:644 stop:895 length:252 start_codon:yes stop_codon:yes gene_type:complete